MGTQSQLLRHRSDEPEPQPVEFRSGEGELRRSDQFFDVTTASEVAPDVVVRVSPVRRRPVSRSFLDRLVSEYVAHAVRHARLRQMPDGYWIADVVGLDGPWADGSTADEALIALGPIIAEWLVLKVEDKDGDIPPLAGINLNQYVL